MPRAKIPYQELEKKVRKMFPFPIYRDVFLRKPRRDNNVKAPISVYDRRSGNYKVSGYICQISYEIFQGLDDGSYYGWGTRYSPKDVTVMVMLN